MLDIKIRRLARSDSDGLSEIYSFPSVMENTSQLPFISADSMIGIIDNERAYTLVAEVDGKIGGHITFFLSTKLREKHKGRARRRRQGSAILAVGVCFPCWTRT